MDPSPPHARLPEPLVRLVDRCRDDVAEPLRFRFTPTRSVVHHAGPRPGRRLLSSSLAAAGSAALRAAAGARAGARWTLGRLPWEGGPLLVEWRRCLVGERATIRLRGEGDGRSPALRRALQAVLLRALDSRRPGPSTPQDGPEQAHALRLLLSAADLQSLTEAALDLALLDAFAGEALALDLSREAGRGLAALMAEGRTEAAAVLVREARALPDPGSGLVGRCRRLLVGPLLAAGSRPPERRPLRPLA